MAKTVVIGLLGATLDGGKGAARWERWRPSVALCQHDELLIDRFELLYQAPFEELSETVAADIARVSPETDVRRTLVPMDEAWDFEKVYAALHDFARAYPFEPEREDYLVHITTGTHVAQICLFLLAESRHLPARLIQGSPPRRGTREAGSYAIIDLDLSKYDRIAARFRREQRDGQSLLKAGIATKSPRFNDLIAQIERVALGSTSPLLLLGPTGAGKSQLARLVFELKKKRQKVSGELVEVNCATVRGDGAMSTLFGHVRGAFTGAAADRPGMLRKAHRGVLFLDEIAELGIEEQAMLLRAIEDRSFYPVGSDRLVESDFQLIAGTNRDLLREVRDGRFRDDLLARIDVWTFRLPGLAERREDIEPNLAFELERCGSTLGVHTTMSRDARQKFLAFATSSRARWSANFRDLSSAVLRMATLAPGGRITATEVVEETARLRASWSHERPDAAEDLVERTLGRERALGLDRFDRAQLGDVLAVCAESESLSEAGRALFASSRARRTSTNDADRLRKYLARFDIDWRTALRSARLRGA